jgi:hypothetical protein
LGAHAADSRPKIRVDSCPFVVTIDLDNSMDRKSFLPFALVLASLLIAADTSEVAAANMRSFIEGVRRKATVVYVGSIKEVRLLERTKFDIKARALVDVLSVV